MRKEDATRLMDDVKQGQEFNLSNRLLHNAAELLTELRVLDDRTAAFYNNYYRMDFCNWIADAVGDKRLARDMRNIKQRNNLLKIMDARLARLRTFRKHPEESMLKSELRMYVDKIRLEIDTEICSSCEICSSVCPQQALSIENRHLKLDNSKCSHCGICVNFCPLGCISLKYNDADYNPPRRSMLIPSLPAMQDINGVQSSMFFDGKISIKDRCNQGCEECIAACPVNIISRIDHENNQPEKALIDDSKCLLCGACKVACPQNIIEIRRTRIRSKGSEFSKAWQDIMQKLLRDESASLFHHNRNAAKVEKLMDKVKNGR